MRRTSPAQNISLGHHACCGGSGTCDGSAFVRGTVGLATAVDNVMDGVPMLAAPAVEDAALEAAWGTARAACASHSAAARRARIVFIVAREVGRGQQGSPTPHVAAFL